MTLDTPAGHPVFAALYGWLADAIEAGPVGAARRELLADARGVVVDLGAGIGANLPHLPPAVSTVHLVEPDPHMIRRLERDLPDHAVIHQTGAEDLPFAGSSIDTVLATLTLCTVHDLPRSISEIRRVLRPGGQLLILEHVRSTNPWVARGQDLLQGPWQWAGGGCHPNRDTAAALAAEGFDPTPLTRIATPTMLLAQDWITGRLS
jgi:ubiquinone/menaquinone biosynthesis C-methylase UbiE